MTGNTSSVLSTEELASIAAFGDRLKLLRKLIDFIRSLNLDFGQLVELVREAVSLFGDGFTLDKLLAFVEKLLAIFNAAPRPEAATASSILGAGLKDWLDEIVLAIGILKRLLG